MHVNDLEAVYFVNYEENNCSLLISYYVENWLPSATTAKLCRKGAKEICVLHLDISVRYSINTHMKFSNIKTCSAEVTGKLGCLRVVSLCEQ